MIVLVCLLFRKKMKQVCVEKKGLDSVDASTALLCAVVSFPPWAMGILSSVRSGRSPLHRRAFGLSGSGSLAQAVS